ncbi:type VII secretion protein EccB [Rhodococcus kronopolitis]|uniref:Type VII secretion protein EccB n=1 Tax=Rhodococcus kronopolitis TaxID=1460226 RepID=A0ABV9FV25_9NOCA
MAAQPTTRVQVSGYRFLVRRMEHALVRRDVRMLHDPMRSQSRAMTVGAVVAVVGLAACAALALVRPQDRIGDAPIVVGKDSGAMFVALGDTLHPALNLASARLISGSSAAPVTVKESELGSRPRGALVGIPGAPSALPDGELSSWSVCDTLDAGGNRVVSTAVLGVDPVLGEQAAALTDSQALLARGSGGVFLVRAGTRSRVDLDDHAVSLAFGLDGVEPRPVSAGLLAAIPEAPALTPPQIDGRGELPSYSLGGKTVGSVVQVRGAGETAFYVLLRGGLQRVGQATADLIRYSDSQGDAATDTVTPDLVSRLPRSEDLAVSSFPLEAPEIVGSAGSPVSCLSWKPVPGAEEAPGGLRASISVIAGNALPLPDGARPVVLAQADGTGENADSAYLRPGSGGLVHSTGVTPTSERSGALFFVADTGVRFGIENAEAAKALGFSAPGSPAPWQILSLLASGPTLARQAAFLAHDGVAPDDHPVAVSDPAR